MGFGASSSTSRKNKKTTKGIKISLSTIIKGKQSLWYRVPSNSSTKRKRPMRGSGELQA
jgi:hypothetical protein